MTVIPNFLLKRIYVSGSLRREDGGIAFDLKNIVGPGLITRVNAIALDDTEFLAEQICLRKGDLAMPASELSDTNPLNIQLNEKLQLLVRDTELPEGKHRITIDVTIREAGKVAVTVEDTLPA